jgi:hypothetical protein
MEHADVLDETDGQRLAGCSVDQMFDDLLRDQEPNVAVFDSPYFKKDNDNEK